MSGVISISIETFHVNTGKHNWAKYKHLNTVVRSEFEKGSSNAKEKDKMLTKL